MSEKTSNYQLNQWEATDNFLRTDFNEDNAKIDNALTLLSGRLQVEFGSYVGTGTFGPGTQNTITFSITPKIIIVVADTQSTSHPGALFLAGQQYSNGFGNTSSHGQYGLTLSWGENTLSWTTKFAANNGANAHGQLNASGVTYRYAVIG